MWKDFILGACLCNDSIATNTLLPSETAEEADSHEALEVDDEYYPQLPTNILELRLHRRKAVYGCSEAYVAFLPYTMWCLLNIIT